MPSSTTGPPRDESGEWCTFETLIAVHNLDGDAALVRLAKNAHAADIAQDVEHPRRFRRYEALVAWCAREVAADAAAAPA
jgi:hypothetical protein